MSHTAHSRMGFVLAGGKSTRMGSEKSFVELGGRTLLDRALAAMSTVCDEVAIVGDPVKFANWGLVVADIFSGCGPLGGVHAALTKSPAELNLMLAVDMPFVAEELLEFLFAAAEGNDATVTVPRTVDGIQPLCAIYRREFVHAAEEALLAGSYKIAAAFSGVAVRIIGEKELATAGFSERMFFNVNTPQDRSSAEGRSF